MISAEKKNFLVRHTVLSNYLMSCAFFWMLIILFGAIVVGALRVAPPIQPWMVWSVTLPGSWMPSLSAAIVIPSAKDPETVADLFAGVLRFKLPVRWCLTSLIPLGVISLAALTYRLSGGASGKESDWRGFNLPRLLERYSPLKASLMFGLMWRLRHLGVWSVVASSYSETMLPVYILEFTGMIVALNLLMVWIYQYVPDSLGPMVIAHFTSNISGTLVLPGALGLGARMPLFGWQAFSYSSQ
jgi:hypothetical protein